jgi:hypothetical protein
VKKRKNPSRSGLGVVQPTASGPSAAVRGEEAEQAPPTGKVIEFPGRADEPQAGDGDGGDGTEIVIRILVDWPDTPEDAIPEPEPDPEPERKSGLGPFIWGALIGWWLGG